MPDPDLEIMRGWGAVIKTFRYGDGGGGVWYSLPPKMFWPFGSQFALGGEGGWGWSPGPLPWIQHWVGGQFPRNV